MIENANRRKPCVALVLAAMWAPGVVQAEAIDVNGYYAAPARDVALLHSLEVERFSGEDGPKLARTIERVLGSIADRRGGPYFTIVAGQSAEGGVSGHVTTGVDISRYTSTVKRCPDDATSCTKDEKVEVKIDCKRRVITLDADIRVARVVDGRVIYSDAIPQRQEASWCVGQSSPTEPESVIRAMIEATAASFGEQVAPVERRQRVRVREDRKGLTKPEAARFKLALSQTKADVRSACATWAEQDRTIPGHPSVVFNLALCAEAAGDLDGAGALYAQLPDQSDVRSGSDRVRSRIAANEDEEERARRGRR